MKSNDASLDRLYDIVLPPSVSWWPLAPGWYVLLSLAFVVLLVLSFRAWKTWRSNAYRREALRELDRSDSVAAISEILRRTALAIVPRSSLASLTDTEWPNWLATKVSVPMPKQVQDQLSRGIYREQDMGIDLGPLKEFAACWIRQHRVPESSQR